MPLKYPADWKYEGFPREIPNEAHREFIDLIDMVVEGVDRPKALYEDFKSGFGDTSSSSDAGWAQSDRSERHSPFSMKLAKFQAASIFVSFPPNYWGTLWEIPAILEVRSESSPGSAFWSEVLFS